MAKRKHENDEEEETPNHDYQDDQSVDYEDDEDEETSSASAYDNEGPSNPTRRVTRSSARTAGNVDENTEATPSVADQATENSDQPRGTRVRKTGDTKYCGVITAFIKEPEKAKRSKGDFSCIICDSTFTRREGVNYHFPNCVERHGNPEGHRWNDHPSCSTKPVAKEAPPAKKQRVSVHASGSSGKPSGSGRVALPRASALPVVPRAPTKKLPVVPAGRRIRPKRTMMIAQPQVSSQASSQQHTKPVAPSKVPSKSKASRKRAPRKSASEAKPRSQKYEIDQGLPPLSQIDDIFLDMVRRALQNPNIAAAMQELAGKWVHVATMCSGTESPVLALDMIDNGLRASGKPGLNRKHLFSAEIVPFKQAYIERNFHPDKLFRDIREMAAGGKATTAYGALTNVPTDVDILVAGFSCVDFSRLNKAGKKLTDSGESGDTFRAIINYAKAYRPPVIILENVDGAPWDLLKAIWQNDQEDIDAYFATHTAKTKENEQGANEQGANEQAANEPAADEPAANEQGANAQGENAQGENAQGENAQGSNRWLDEDDIGYSAMWHKVDAKHYYIPHTRTRKYMICLDRRRFPSKEAADDAVQDWKSYMVALERKASVTVEEFLLPDDDPRLQRAKDEMSKVGKPRHDRNWDLCNGRHEGYRSDLKLGTGRPILHWTNDGAAKPSSYVWTEWILSQVERVWDSVEISFLRNALRGFDSFFKSRFWNLSQNIDRFTDLTPAGITGCITPCGQPFSTIRGRPIVGLEALALQGLPIDTLLLTRESQSELLDMAGNAMTSTVVGAALLSALTVSHKLLTRPKESVSQSLHGSSSTLKEMRLSELQQSRALKFGEIEHLEFEELWKMAKASFRLCHCEGQSLTAPTLIRKCENCNHHCCEKCGNMPKHNYQLLGGKEAPLRIKPQEFRNLVSRGLPTRLQVNAWSVEFEQELGNQTGQDWQLFKEAFLVALKQEYRYESAKRSYTWSVIYDAAASRLELIFDQGGIYWLLYGKPDSSETGNSRVRQILEQPLARLIIRGKNIEGETIESVDLLDGCWEIRLPVNHTFALSISPKGELTDSWEKRLGLEDDQFVDKQVFTSLQIAPASDSVSDMSLGQQFYGTYDLLEQCGTASSSLHKRRATADDDDDDAPLFLFLDPDRNGPALEDGYVFSTHKQSLEYGEVRQVVAKIDSKWRPPNKYKNATGESAEPKKVDCTVLGQWILHPMALQSHEGPDGSSSFPKSEISMPVFGADHGLSQSSAEDIHGCLHEAATTALLSCEVPKQSADTVGWQVGHWTIVDLRSERRIAAAFAWLFARVKSLGDFHCDWRSLGSCPNEYRQCPVCAPEPPRIMWTSSRSAKQTKIIPYEDNREAGRFERNIKARPAPFLVQTSLDHDEERTGRLRVGLHLPTLVHRALATLGNITNSDDVEIKWRLDTRFEAPTRYKLKEFTLTNNKLTVEAEYDFPTGETLRPDQKRSLKWMIGQEADDMAFYEEEIEEATLSQLGWLAEVRVRRTRSVRGGILADEVGYGKTATTLALIDALKDRAEEYAEVENLGCIPIKATLIIVPPHLVHQWEGQARKFLGIDFNDERILVIQEIKELPGTSIKRIRKASIVLISWKILTSPAYLSRMSHFAALPVGPSNGEREIDAWLTRTCDNIKEHVDELVHQGITPHRLSKSLKERLTAAHNDQEILRDVPTQRLKGGQYNTWSPTDSVKTKNSSPTVAELNKYFKRMINCTDLEAMTGILLHMFDFYRIVVDEYTYVKKDRQVDILSSFIASINARSRWVLSGTPTIQDFGDVRSLASFLAYNLGVEDDTAGVVKGATIRRIRDNRTAAERFWAFGYSHTAAWHISRQAHAQRFLDKYASKNVAEIAPIESRMHLRPHLLGTIETVLNAELQQQLQATDMTIVLRGKTKEDNDRIQRYKDLLRGCNTASECLLRVCSYFDFNPTRSGENDSLDDASVIAEDCKALIAIREKQMESLVVELESNLLHAAWLEQQCERATKEDERGAHYRQWTSEIYRNTLRDPTATSDLRRYICEAWVKVDDDTEEKYYRNPLTKAQKAEEKKAADERKAFEKDKKAKAKKAKKSKAGEAKAGEDSADATEPAPPDLRAFKIGNDDFKAYNGALRNLTGLLRQLAKELASRTRSLRFARCAYDLHEWHNNPGGTLTCMACNKVIFDGDKISINIGCGHLTCEECIPKDVDAICPVHRCVGQAESFCLRKVADFVGNGQTGNYGSKVGHIIALINSIPGDEQVLLFVQFEEVMLKIALALEAANISNYALSKQEDGREINRMMNDFQENDGEDKKKVLLLDPSSATAAGINLTNANHVIFVSPLLTKYQQSYDASMTQSIGRAKRFGQQKTVHVYRFLALRTIDVDILQEREHKTLVKKNDFEEGEAVEASEAGEGQPDEEWFLVDETEIDGTMEAGWGSGYDFKSNPFEEDD